MQPDGLLEGDQTCERNPPPVRGDARRFLRDPGETMEDQLMMKQVEVLLDIHTKKLQSQIAELKEELSRVRDDIRKSVKEVRREDPPASPSVPTAQSSEFQPRATAPSSQPIDRNGVAPEDVSIEKIFYSGSR